MLDIETPNDHWLLDVIRIIAFHGESGRLQMTAGLAQGVFFFRNGKLVDASIGSLTGFQAINAAVSMGEAHFSFEPSISPPRSSSITSTERIILKQFFAIETLDPECNHHGTDSEPNWDITPAQVVPLTDVALSEVSATDPENIATVEALPSANEVPGLMMEAEVSPNDPVNIAPVEALQSANEVPGLMNEEVRWLEENPEQRIAEDDSEVSKTIPHRGLPVWAQHRSALYVAMVFVLMAVGAAALVRIASRVDSPSAARPSEALATQGPVVTPKESVDKSTDKSSEASIAKPSESMVPVPEQQSKRIEQGNAVAPNLTGKWTVVNTVEKTSYRSFKNLEIAFRLAINQTGRQFTAKGEKISENGRSLPASNRTPIHVTGSINGDTIEATFFEEGSLRKTNGRFVWRIEKTGSGLAGTFVSNAARSRGKSAATREL